MTDKEFHIRKPDGVELVKTNVSVYNTTKLRWFNDDGDFDIPGWYCIQPWINDGTTFAPREPLYIEVLEKYQERLP